MALEYITIQRAEHESLMREVKRGHEVCEEVSRLRTVLQALTGRFEARADRVALKILERAIESCEDVSRLGVELSALERRLSEFLEQERPPKRDEEPPTVRPPSRTNMTAASEAFQSANDYASGKKKPPGGSSGASD